MITRIRQWLAPPQFERDEELNRVARLINTLGLLYLSVLVIAAAILVPFFAIHKTAAWAIIAVLLGLFGISRYLLFRGYVRSSGVLIVIAVWAIFQGLAVFSGGVYSPVSVSIVGMSIIIGLVVESTVGYAIASGSILVELGLAVLQTNHYPLPQVFFLSPLATWLWITLALGFFYSTVNVFTHSLQDALSLARQQNAARQRAEATLRENEVLLSNAFNHSPLLMTISDLTTGTFLEVNDSFCAVSEFSRQEVIGKTSLDIGWMNEKERLWLVSELHQYGKVTGLELTLRSKHGKTIICRYAGDVVQTAQGPRLFSTAEDITERKQAEDALRASEAKFRAVVENSNDGIIFSDADSRIVYRSPSYYQINGYTDEERLGHSGFETVHPDDTDELHRYWAALVEHPGVSQKTEYRIRHKDGTWRWVETSGLNLLDNPDVQAIVITSRDITDRKLALDEVTLKNKQLAMLNRLGQALNSLAPLSEIMERISDLIGQVFDNRNLYIALYDEATNYVSFPIYWMVGERSDSLDGRPLSNGLTEWVIRTRAPLLIPDHVEELLAERGIALIGRICRCYLGVPILMDEHVIGVIAVQDYDRPQVYNTDHIELLSTIASQAAISIQNARLYETAQRELSERKRAEEALRLSEQTARRAAEQLRMVNQIALKITAGLDFERLMETIYEQCQQIGDTDTFYIALYDDTTATVSFPFNYKDGDRTPFPSRNIREQPGLVSYIVNNRQTLFYPDETYLPAGITPIRQAGLPSQSFIGVPLILNDRVVGILSMQSHRPSAYTSEQVQMLELLVTQVAIAIQNSQLYQQVQNERNLANALIDHLPGGFGLIDQAGHPVRWNKYIETALGYSPEEINDLDFLSVFPAEEQARLPGLISQAFSGEQVIAETQLVTKQGVKIPFYATGTRVQIGNETHLLVIGMDVTERKRAEEALLESEKRFRTVVDQAPVAISISRDGICIYTNQKFMDTFGLQKFEQLVGQPIYEIFAPQFQEESKERTRRRALGLPVAVEFESMGLRSDGSHFPIQVVVAPVQLSDGKANIAFITDITERKRVHDLLKESEERYKVMFESAPIAINVTRGTEITYANPSYLTMYGFSTFDELKARAPLELFAPESRAQILENIQRRAQGFTVPDHYEAACFRADGSRFPVLMYLTRAEFADGKATVAFVLDITDRKQAEEEVHQLNLELERRVRDRTAQLEASNRELEAFSYSVSHDLRAPLRALSGFSEILAENYRGLLDQDGLRYLAHIQEASEQMKALINALLELSRVSRKEVDMTQVDLSQIAHEITAEFHRGAPDRVVEVIIAAGLVVEGDYYLLRNVMQNLLDNAWKFTQNCAYAKIEVGALERNRPENGLPEKVYFVRDNGAGFDMAFAGKLFTPFQRLHKVSDYPGTGIGLSTVQRIINRHGGRVWAEAVTNQGASFFFTLGEVQK